LLTLAAISVACSAQETHLIGRGQHMGPNGAAQQLIYASSLVNELSGMEVGTRKAFAYFTPGGGWRWISELFWAESR
jgi:hypothetical protein